MLSVISRAALLIFAAVMTVAMAAAVVTFSMMSVAVMAALDIRIKGKISGQERFYRFICVSGHAAVKLDAGVRKGVLGSHSDTAADQRVHAHLFQEACQSAVSAAIGIRNLLFYNTAVLHIIELKLFCVSKVLKYISVFKCYCNSHLMISFQPD